MKALTTTAGAKVRIGAVVTRADGTVEVYDDLTYTPPAERARRAMSGLSFEPEQVPTRIEKE